MNEQPPAALAPSVALERLAEIVGSMRNFADVADRCELTEGNAPAAIRSWAEMLTDLTPSLAQKGGAVDREVRQWRRFYFRHNPASTLLAQIFNDILRANGTYESDWESNARREDAALQPAASEGEKA